MAIRQRVLGDRTGCIPSLLANSASGGYLDFHRSEGHCSGPPGAAKSQLRSEFALAMGRYRARMARWMVRGGLGGLLAVGSMLAASPPPALACSGPPLTFADAVATSELIVEGTIDEVLLDGLAYRLSVIEVFKGPPVGSAVRLGPAADDEAGRGCEVGLAVGDHVILGVVDADAHLNSLATAVWFVAPDGGLSSPGELWRVAADADALRVLLRAAVPDTAVPPAADPTWPRLIAGAGLLAAAAVLGSGAGRRRDARSG